MAYVKQKHYEIFDYWKDKYISADGQVHDESNKKKDDVRVVYDWGEPCCWACDIPINMNQDGYQEALYDGDFKRIWNYSKVSSHLEKCHIYPEAAGGLSEPSNVFLMCKRCHEQSPDTKDPGNFFRWVYRKRRHCAMGLDLYDKNAW